MPLKAPTGSGPPLPKPPSKANMPSRTRKAANAIGTKFDDCDAVFAFDFLLPFFFAMSESSSGLTGGSNQFLFTILAYLF
jgi:hypothetical protein